MLSFSLLGQSRYGLLIQLSVHCSLAVPAPPARPLLLTVFDFVYPPYGSGSMIVLFFHSYLLVLLLYTAAVVCKDLSLLSLYSAVNVINCVLDLLCAY
jgi:hypothetical protein